MAKTIDEIINETQAKIEQYKNKETQLLQKQKTFECKARTRRLIERGAIAEGLIENAESLTNQQFKSILEAALNADS